MNRSVKLIGLSRYNELVLQVVAGGPSAGVQGEIIEAWEFKDLCFDPFIDGETWEDNVTKWPDVQFGEIYCYLVDTPGQFTRETLKAYRSLEAYNFFHNGWVHTVLSSTLGSDKCFLKAKVNRSQALSEKPHEAWVCVDTDCTILNAHCTCMAG